MRATILALALSAAGAAAAEEALPAQFRAPYANGFFGYAEPSLGGSTDGIQALVSLRPAVGVDLRSIKLAAVGDWSFQLATKTPGGTLTPSASNFALGVLSPSLIVETRSGVALSPGLGLTVPIESLEPITTLDANLRFEVALGPVELRDRVDVRKLIYKPDPVPPCRFVSTGDPCAGASAIPSVVFANELLAEVHAGDSFSGGFAFAFQKTLYLAGDGEALSCSLFVRWAVTRHLLAGVSLDTAAPHLRASNRQLFSSETSVVRATLALRSGEGVASHWLEP